MITSVGEIEENQKNENDYHCLFNQVDAFVNTLDLNLYRQELQQRHQALKDQEIALNQSNNKIQYLREG